MSYLLNLVYLLLILASSPWLVYAAIRKGKYRRGLAAKFLGRVPRRESDNECVWLHAVSVGEVNLLGTLIDEIAVRRPDWQCVVSTTTITGMALARKKYPHLSVFYCPLDFSWAVRAAVRRIRPRLLVLAELELWPNLIRAVRQSGARVAVINGRLGEHSFRGYRRVRPLVARLLAKIDLMAVQDEKDHHRGLHIEDAERRRPFVHLIDHALRHVRPSLHVDQPARRAESEENHRRDKTEGHADYDLLDHQKEEAVPRGEVGRKIDQ